MFLLFESIKVKAGIAEYLRFHQERVDRSYQLYFNRKPVFSLEKIIRVPDDFCDGIVKCRFRYNENDYELEFEYYRPKFIRKLKLVYAEGIDYSMKFTDRSELDTLFLEKEGMDDILIVNNGYISDSSFSNIVFNNGRQWITPAQPLLEGTQRHRLLRAGRIKEKAIRPEDLPSYVSFKLINAMLDFDEQAEISVSEGIT